MQANTELVTFTTYDSDTLEVMTRFYAMDEPERSYVFSVLQHLAGEISIEELQTTIPADVFQLFIKFKAAQDAKESSKGGTADAA